VKDEFAGRTTKCRKCSQPVTVPKPAPPPEEPTELGSWMDEEISALLPKTPAPTPDPTSIPCPGCGSALAATAKLCVRCGYDVAVGQKRATQRPDATPKKKKSRAAGFAWNLGKGVAISSVGALLGAIVWAMIAIATNHEIGWVAWGIGAAAGGGMSVGYDENSDDGLIPGVLAAFIALGGIVLGKIFIVVWVIYPLVVGQPEDFAFKRELLAGDMAAKAVKARNLDPDDQLAHSQEYDKAMTSLASLSDEEIEERYTAYLGEFQAELERANAEDAVAAQAAAQAPGQQQAAMQMPDAGGAFDEAEENPSLIGLFFSAMFGPMDAVFILLAFFTAYKIGSGTSSD
jgi:hypothetical protein